MTPPFSRAAVLRPACAIAAARPTVWEHLTVPGHRPKWQATDVVHENTGGKRRGVGTQNHCMHGKAALIEDVADWRSFDYVTMDCLLPIPDSPRVMVTYAFADRADGGTHVEVRIGKPKPKDRAFFEQMQPVWQETFTVALRNLRVLLAGETGAPAVVDEPAAAASSQRFLTMPVAHRH